ncbi:DUF1707 and DUF4870 domain-containing protein [Streptomonospora sp. PA3]|uniref:DUF4870 domain-containing protein n=1 Tax=Streptomonospora sp. PA3 TaxID=2607326 RepID=UPI0016426869
MPERRRSGGKELRLTHADRDTAVETLREAYASGQLDENELEERLGLAINAKFPSDLEPLLADLVSSRQGVPGRSAKAPAADDGPLSAADRLLAAAGHFSGYFSFVGPLLMLLVSRETSPFVRRHVTEALNYQLTIAVGGIVAMGLFWLLVPPFLWALMLVGWMFLPAVAGFLALVGGEMRYPFTWRPVRDDPPREG